jgi:hypothetical protein
MEKKKLNTPVPPKKTKKDKTKGNLKKSRIAAAS